jgi:hypothetical protein
METEQLRDLSEQAARIIAASQEPISARSIASAIMRDVSSLLPQPLYDPSETYSEGQRLYHASPACEGWFTIEKVGSNRITAKFDNGTTRTLAHNSKQHPDFPTTPLSYLITILEQLLPSISNLREINGAWFDHREVVDSFDHKDQLAIPENQATNNDVEQSEVTFQTVLAKYGVEHFYHITHLKNLASIMKKGLICRKLLQPMAERGLITFLEDISNQEIQAHRHEKRIPLFQEFTLHDYVPLFIVPNPPMLNALRHQRDNIIYLYINLIVINHAQSVFTDGNASSDTNFFNQPSDLERLDWNILRSNEWKLIMGVKEYRRKRAAEVLVRRQVLPSEITCVSVYSSRARQEVLQILKIAQESRSVGIQPDLYPYHWACD